MISMTNKERMHSNSEEEIRKSIFFNCIIIIILFYVNKNMQ